ncbi:hypothetical protein GQ457_04G029770 [Hibiscus cannabinus]
MSINVEIVSDNPDMTVKEARNSFLDPKASSGKTLAAVTSQRRRHASPPSSVVSHRWPSSLRETDTTTVFVPNSSFSSPDQLFKIVVKSLRKRLRPFVFNAVDRRLVIVPTIQEPCSEALGSLSPFLDYSGVCCSPHPDEPSDRSDPLSEPLNADGGGNRNGFEW